MPIVFINKTQPKQQQQQQQQQQTKQPSASSRRRVAKLRSQADNQQQSQRKILPLSGNMSKFAQGKQFIDSPNPRIAERLPASLLQNAVMCRDRATVRRLQSEVFLPPDLPQNDDQSTIVEAQELAVPSRRAAACALLFRHGFTSFRGLPATQSEFSPRERDVVGAIVAVPNSCDAMSRDRNDKFSQRSMTVYFVPLSDDDSEEDCLIDLASTDAESSDSAEREDSLVPVAERLGIIAELCLCLVGGQKLRHDVVVWNLQFCATALFCRKWMNALKGEDPVRMSAAVRTDDRRDQLSRDGLTTSRSGYVYDPVLALWLLNPERISDAVSSSKTRGQGFIDFAVECRARDLQVDQNKKNPWDAIFSDISLSLELWASICGENSSSEAPRESSVFLSKELIVQLQSIEQPVSIILAKMESFGITCSAESLNSSINVLRSIIDAASDAANSAAGSAVNLADNAAITSLLFDRFGLTDRSRRRVRSVSKIDLTRMLGSIAHIAGTPINPAIKFIRALQRFRTASKNLSIAETLSMRAVSQQVSTLDRRPASRIFAHWKHIGTATGRVSCAQPNLQTIPGKQLGEHRTTAEGNVLYNIRDSIVPRHHGRLLAAFDYKQLELRILAHLSHSESLIAIFEGKHDVDVFQIIAARLHSIPVGQVSSEHRKQAKTVAYAVTYGMGSRSLAQTLTISEERARKFIDDFLNVLQLRQCIIDAKASVREHAKHHVVTLLGRHRALPDIVSSDVAMRRRAERQAISTLVQGTAADLVKHAMIRTDTLLSTINSSAPHRSDQWPCHVLMQIHDELVLDVCPCCASTVIPAVASAMETALPLEVPLRVSVSIGERWGELTEIIVPEVTRQQREALWRANIDQRLVTMRVKEEAAAKTTLRPAESSGQLQLTVDQASAQQRVTTKNQPSVGQAHNKRIVSLPRLSDSDRDSSLSESDDCSIEHEPTTTALKTDAIYSAYENVSVERSYAEARKRHEAGEMMLRRAKRGDLNARTPLDHWLYGTVQRKRKSAEAAAAELATATRSTITGTDTLECPARRKRAAPPASRDEHSSNVPSINPAAVNDEELDADVEMLLAAGNL